MKLTELLDLPHIVKRQEILTNKQDLYIVFSNKINAWIHCHSSGKAKVDKLGNLIKFSPTKENLEEDGWFIWGPSAEDILKRKHKQKQSYSPAIDREKEKQEQTWRTISALTEKGVEEAVVLGQAALMGMVLHCLNDGELNKQQIKNILFKYMGDDEEFRNLSYLIMGDIEKTMSRKVDKLKKM